MTLTSGSTTLKFPITEAYAPNAFVSIFVARGRSAPPGRSTIRAGRRFASGYAELRVTPEVKRLAVDVTAARSGVPPGDSAQRARAGARREGRGPAQRGDALGGGRRRARAHRLQDARSDRPALSRARARDAAREQHDRPSRRRFRKAKRDGANRAAAAARRAPTCCAANSRRTAFFLGSVVTDAQGNATATAKLPDNLTTFRVMAVAVTAGDRYGKGESPMLVTRPLVARPALPRFVRPGDDVHRRRGDQPARRHADGARDASGDAGVDARAATRRRARRSRRGRGREVRFPFRATPHRQRASSAST